MARRTCGGAYGSVGQVAVPLGQQFPRILGACGCAVVTMRGHCRTELAQRGARAWSLYCPSQRECFGGYVPAPRLRARSRPGLKPEREIGSTESPSDARVPPNARRGERHRVESEPCSPCTASEPRGERLAPARTTSPVTAVAGVAPGVRARLRASSSRSVGRKRARRMSRDQLRVFTRSWGQRHDSMVSGRRYPRL
jgi:hypothetical protein